MNLQQIMHHYNFPEQPGKIEHKSENHLGIRKIDRIYDSHREQLILMVKSNPLLEKEIEAFVKGSKLILEASCPLDYNKPVHTHLLDGERPDQYDNNVTIIGFSEIKLKPGYHYSLISCQLMKPGLIKVILKYTPNLFHKDSVKNLKKNN